MKKLSVVLFVALALSGCDNRSDAQKEFDRNPHVIRQFDDCKVYAFEEDGSMHYFTRCRNSTVTHEHDWTEQQGKTQVHKQETTVTTDQ